MPTIIEINLFSFFVFRLFLIWISTLLYGMNCNGIQGTAAIHLYQNTVKYLIIMNRKTVVLYHQLFMMMIPDQYKALQYLDHRHPTIRHRRTSKTVTSVP